MVVSFGAAWPGNAELKATTKSVKGQGLALLPSKPPRSGFVQLLAFVLAEVGRDTSIPDLPHHARVRAGDDERGVVDGALIGERQEPVGGDTQRDVRALLACLVAGDQA